MAPRRSKSVPAQQGGLFCCTCGALLISSDEQRQQECDRCYDLFVPEPAVPASPVSVEPIGEDLAAAWLAVERQVGDYPALTEHAGVWLVAIGYYEADEHQVVSSVSCIHEGGCYDQVGISIGGCVYC